MSRLKNPDLAPTTASQRHWSTWHIAALWIGMAVCIPTYQLASQMIGQGMSWWQAALTVLLGNLIVLIPMILNGHPGVKYGIPFPVLMRASFGTSGANIPALARAVVACGWFGVQTWIGGKAIYTVLIALGAIDGAAEAARSATSTVTAWELTCFLVFWLINLHFVWHGMNSIKRLESWSAPILIAAGLALLAWALVKVDSPGALFAEPSHFATSGDFLKAFIPQLTAMVGFWSTLALNIPDFTRFSKDQKSQALGQLLGLPTTMTLFAVIGILVTAATVRIYGEAIWDPVELIRRIGSPAVIVASLVILSVATLSTNIAANVVSPANDFSNLAPSRISFRAGGMITAILGILICPWYLVESTSGYVFVWLIGYSGLLGPVAGIMLCDYFILRKTILNVDALYDAGGEYSYGSGFNWRAMLALGIGILPSLPGFINAASGKAIFPAIFDSIYGFAWFVGLGVAMTVYFVVTRLLPAASHGRVPGGR